MEPLGPIEFESSLTPRFAGEFQETLLLALPSGLPSPIEAALAQYADTLERLVGVESISAADAYTRGFVTGLRAAAKFAANVNGL